MDEALKKAFNLAGDIIDEAKKVNEKKKSLIWWLIIVKRLIPLEVL